MWNCLSSSCFIVICSLIIEILDFLGEYQRFLKSVYFSFLMMFLLLFILWILERMVVCQFSTKTDWISQTLKFLSYWGFPFLKCSPFALFLILWIRSRLEDFIPNSIILLEKLGVTESYLTTIFKGKMGNIEIYFGKVYLCPKGICPYFNKLRERCLILKLLKAYSLLRWM